MHLIRLEKRKKDKEKNSVKNLLAKQQTIARPKVGSRHLTCKKPVNEEADKALLDNIFNDLEQDYTKVEESVKKRKVSDIPIKRKKPVSQAVFEQDLSQVSNEIHDSYEAVHDPVDMQDTVVVQDKPPVTSHEPAPLKTSAIKISKNAKKASSFLPKFEKEQIETKEADLSKPLTKNNYQDWRDIQKGFTESTLAQETPLDSNVAQQDFLESDGSMHLFWIDAFEKKGRVFLFGKVASCIYPSRLPLSLHHPSSMLAVA